MNSIQLTIKANEAEQEILISELVDLGVEGFEQTEDQLIAYFSENNFPSHAVKTILSDHQFHINTLEERNWNELWETNFQPVVVEDFCSIRATFHEPIPGVKHEILITPKMSFGTGHHATTYMMIEQMRGMDFMGKKVFDFGTGTGILSILAEKIGAGSIYAIDIDEWSILNSRENVDENHCTKVQLALTSQIPEAKFDIILANINRNVILDYLNELNNCLVKGGNILLSGLLKSDETDVMQACEQASWKLLKQTERNNWISLFYIK